jgi:hypothetical protein
LVQYNVIEYAMTGPAQALRQAPRLAAVPLEQLGKPGSAERT